MTQSAERRLAAILSGDVASYSRLVADDAEATARALEACREEVGRLVARHLGRLADFVGDAFLAEFPSALDAVRAAISIQRSLAQQNAGRPAGRRIALRLGCEVGDVVSDGARLTGGGVNVAARLQALARPGGLCISAGVHAQVHGALELGFDDLGERSLKHIDHPVRVYAVRLDGEAGPRVEPPRRRLRRAGVAATALVLLAGVALWASWPRPLGLLLDATGLAGPPVNPPLPDEPSIVVLPFDNMSGDPDQEYFSDGITEDLTTDLSRTPGLFVIARNSAFHYKGPDVDVKQVGRELGVRYVLEGSVRRANDRVRITVQLIDAQTGFHLWSERYDRELSDIFAVQSDITERIHGALPGLIRQAEFERVRSRPTEDVSAYDAYMRGYGYFVRFTREGHHAARRHLLRAIELDPNYAAAYSNLAVTYAHEYGFGWNRDPALLDRAESYARKALELDPFLADAYVSMTNVHIWRGEPKQALETARRAVELDPNFDAAQFVLGGTLLANGHYLEAIGPMHRALRLNPRPPPPWWAILGAANYLAGRTQEAVALWERTRDANPDFLFPRVLLAAHYQEAGRPEEAAVLVREIRAVNPDLTAESATELVPLAFPRMRERLRAAGLP